MPIMPSSSVESMFVIADMSTKYLSQFPLNEQFFIYMRAINLPDILATVVIGIIVSWAREAYHVYFKEDQDFSWGRGITVPLIGITGALMGGEIANLAGMEESSWLFCISIAWIGGSALDRFATIVIGLIDKALGAIGVRQEQQARHAIAMDKVQQEKELAEKQALVKSLASEPNPPL